MFVQSEKFVESHGGKLGDISIYGQESNATTRRLAIMNLSIRGIEAEIAAHGHVLTPGRYVGAEEVEDDGEPFAEKMPRLVAELQAQFAESAKLEKLIKKNLKGLGYEL
jgi:type I restriction-modification system DNA methylase subunit